MLDTGQVSSANPICKALPVCPQPTNSNRKKACTRPAPICGMRSKTIAIHQTMTSKSFRTGKSRLQSACRGTSTVLSMSRLPLITRIALPVITFCGHANNVLTLTCWLVRKTHCRTTGSTPPRHGARLFLKSSIQPVGLQIAARLG